MLEHIYIQPDRWCVSIDVSMEPEVRHSVAFCSAPSSGFTSGVLIMFVTPSSPLLPSFLLMPAFDDCSRPASASTVRPSACQPTAAYTVAPHTATAGSTAILFFAVAALVAAKPYFHSRCCFHLARVCCQLWKLLTWKVKRGDIRRSI